jgi:hypothetical protein
MMLNFLVADTRIDATACQEIEAWLASLLEREEAAR